MKLTIWDLFKYIWKHKVMIGLGTVLSLIAANLYVNNIQTYSAEVEIRYKRRVCVRGKSA